MKKTVLEKPINEQTQAEKKKTFSTYPVYIDNAKKTYILFGIIFLIGIIIFFLYFYQNEARKEGLINNNMSIYLDK